MAKTKSLDAEALALLAATPAGKPGNSCFFVKHRDQAPLLEALRRNGGGHAQIARILTARGLPVKGDTVGRHLRGECQCLRG